MTIHKLTTEQLRKLTKAIGDGSDWPKFTDDPLVNFAVDCVVEYDAGDPEPEYDETLYAEEVVRRRN